MHLQGIPSRTGKKANLLPALLWKLFTFRLVRIENKHAQEKSMRRVCADVFPGSADGIPGSAPGVSDRISWTVQTAESSSSVGRAQENSTQRGGPRKATQAHGASTIGPKHGWSQIGPAV